MNLTKIIVILVLLCTVAYVVFRSGAFITGPGIKLEGVDIVEEAEYIIVSVSGNVTNSNLLTINDRVVFPDERGAFFEELLLPNSISIVEIYSKGRRGKDSIINIPINYDNKEKTNKEGSSEESNYEESNGE